MAEPNVIRLNGGKAYPKDSRPQAISYQWLKSDGSVVDFTGSPSYTGQGRAEAVDGTPATNLGEGGVTIDNNTATAVYSFHLDDFAAIGIFRLIIWAGNTVNRYGSVIFEWEVFDSPGVDPTV